MGKFDNKLSDTKKQEQDRRTELAMLALLIEKYPREARAKINKLPPPKENNPIVLRK